MSLTFYNYDKSMSLTFYNYGSKAVKPQESAEDFRRESSRKLEGLPLSSPWQTDWRADATYIWDCGGSGIIVESTPQEKYFRVALVYSADCEIIGDTVFPYKFMSDSSSARSGLHLKVRLRDLEKVVDQLRAIGEQVNRLRDAGWILMLPKCSASAFYLYHIPTGTWEVSRPAKELWDYKYSHTNPLRRRHLNQWLKRLHAIPSYPQEESASLGAHASKLQQLKTTMAEADSNYLLGLAIKQYPKLPAEQLINIVEEANSARSGNPQEYIRKKAEQLIARHPASERALHEDVLTSADHLLALNENHKVFSNHS